MPAQLFAEPFLGNFLKGRDLGWFEVLAAGSANLRIGEIMFGGLFGWKFEPLSRTRSSLRSVIKPPWTFTPAARAVGLMGPVYGCHRVIGLVVNLVSLHRFRIQRQGRG